MRFKLGTCATMLLLAGMVPTVTQAQSYAVDRGSVLIDGQASFTSTGAEVDGEDVDDRVTQLSITPSLQYFILPGLALGGELTLARAWDDDDSNTVYGIGPAVTYYFGAGERPWYPYLGGSIQFTHEERDSDDGPDLPDVSFRTYKGAAGLLFMMSPGVGINAELFYQLASQDTGDLDLERDIYGLAVGVSAFVF
jgi:hypothetical protein